MQLLQILRSPQHFQHFIRCMRRKLKFSQRLPAVLLLFERRDAALDRLNGSLYHILQMFADVDIHYLII